MSPVAETSVMPLTPADPVSAPGETQVKAPEGGEEPSRMEGASVVGPALPLPELPPEGKAWVWVESEPAGAMVVVDGVPAGRTPRRVELDVTLQGFARRTNTIRVRFVAESARETSVTTELVLTPRDRVPALLHFTRERVVRRQ
jgi:PEGA domain